MALFLFSPAVIFSSELREAKKQELSCLICSTPLKEKELRTAPLSNYTCDHSKQMHAICVRQQILLNKLKQCPIQNCNGKIGGSLPKPKAGQPCTTTTTHLRTFLSVTTGNKEEIKATWSPFGSFGTDLLIAVNDAGITTLSSTLASRWTDIAQRDQTMLDCLLAPSCPLPPSESKKSLKDFILFLQAHEGNLGNLLPILKAIKKEADLVTGFKHIIPRLKERKETEELSFLIEEFPKELLAEQSLYVKSKKFTSLMAKYNFTHSWWVDAPCIDTSEFMNLHGGKTIDGSVCITEIPTETHRVEIHIHSTKKEDGNE